MIGAYSVRQIRAAEALALQGDRDDAVMKRAAYAVAAVVLDRVEPVVGARVVLLVGPGNNGGDALFAGAVLRRRGMSVTAVLLDPDRAHPSGLRALTRSGGRAVPMSDPSVDDLIASAQVLIDGLLGLAASPPMRPPMAALVRKANAARAFKVAVDLPTGIDPDSGRGDGSFVADVTVTFGGMKTSLLVAASAAGEVTVDDLGFEPAGAHTFTLTDLDVRALLPDPRPDGDKFTQGVPGIVAGSRQYPGAAMLCVGGAVSTRPGMVRYAGPQAQAVVNRWPEVVAADDPAEAGAVQAWVAGPGMGTDEGSQALLRHVMAFDGPVLVDADGLTMLARTMSQLEARRGRVTVLTPHGREFARLFPDLDPSDRLASVRAAAARSGAIVLLKGSRTLVADPDGRVAVNTTGTSWLASAGSGDVLSGIIGSLLAAGVPAWQAAAAGAHLHGRAGERAAADRAVGATELWSRIRVPGF
ncbi:yjeF C-terminal region, hydroxyethylthiazole kinase-related/yjeF N-terminal region [Nakamurella panacisegetis]|uniref:Bifunctional NAD(P)H-hydrate repair enzyme n=1 Tax=Nakamurella panacisegetis TaxID=1090615 RepID=A0A1H0P3H1_9ACTN|nr:NAD(P)H-hydrate dehydratase [Nakamurella panacisegetis]SDO99246.1 yjeF C-terminal region, hydroxyethylthiazole kinase-related/yjeF N-terminal region [Nakamurella panacisegetis]